MKLMVAAPPAEESVGLIKPDGAFNFEAERLDDCRRLVAFCIGECAGDLFG